MRVAAQRPKRTVWWWWWWIIVPSRVKGQAVHVGLVSWWHSPDIVCVCEFGYDSALVCMRVCVWAHMFRCERRVEPVREYFPLKGQDTLIKKKIKKKTKVWLLNVRRVYVQSGWTVLGIPDSCCVLRVILQTNNSASGTPHVGHQSFIHHYCSLWILTLSGSLRRRDHPL